MQFWFEFASTYSYPTALRVAALARQQGISLEWKALLLGPIFQAQGWNDSPFNLFPAQGRYMWRDLERLCADLELPFRAWAGSVDDRSSRLRREGRPMGSRLDATVRRWSNTTLARSRQRGQAPAQLSPEACFTREQASASLWGLHQCRAGALVSSGPMAGP